MNTIFGDEQNIVNAKIRRLTNQQKMSRLIVKLGIAKTEQQAYYLLLLLFCLFFSIALFFAIRLLFPLWFTESATQEEVNALSKPARDALEKQKQIR